MKELLYQFFYYQGVLKGEKVFEMDPHGQRSPMRAKENIILTNLMIAPFWPLQQQYLYLTSLPFVV